MLKLTKNGTFTLGTYKARSTQEGRWLVTKPGEAGLVVVGEVDTLIEVEALVAQDKGGE